MKKSDLEKAITKARNKVRDAAYRSRCKAFYEKAGAAVQARNDADATFTVKAEETYREKNAAIQALQELYEKKLEEINTLFAPRLADILKQRQAAKEISDSEHKRAIEELNAEFPDLKEHRSRMWVGEWTPPTEILAAMDAAEREVRDNWSAA